MVSRRKFLQATSLISLAPAFPYLFTRTARAAPSQRDAKALVVVQLDGGNDGINTVVPYADDAYGQARSSLRLESDRVLKLDDHVGLHPSMGRAKQLFDEGKLAIVQGVGYPNPSRSHFRSMNIWQTATFDETDHDGYGWLGRAMDQQCEAGHFVGEGETPVALWGRRSQAIAMADASDLMLQAPSVAPTARSGDDDLRQFVSREISTAYQAAARFEDQLAGARGKEASYPDNPLAAQLKLVSQLLKSGSPGRVYYTVQRGYDTHSAQLYTHSRLLREFSDAIAAFLDDLKSARLDDRVTLLAFSEFGRRVKENDSKGTDHGTAGPVFLAGGAVLGGLVGEAPRLDDLEDGDLRMQVDFRKVYASLLNDWLEVDAKQVLQTSFEGLQLVRR